MGRVLAIGLDAAEPSLLDRLVAEGHMPTLADLRDRGTTARVGDPDHRRGLVWQTFLTGTDAAGIDDPATIVFDPATYDVVQRAADTRPVFHLLDELDVISFDVPYTNPAATGTSTGTATVVSAWGAADPGFARSSEPAGLLRAIDDRFGPHPMAGNDHVLAWWDEAALGRFADGLLEGIRRRTAVLEWLLRTHPWDLTLAVMTEPHAVGEAMWHGVDPDHLLHDLSTADAAEQHVIDVYAAIDASIGELVARFPDATVVVFSLHGIDRRIGDVPAQLLLPELLHRRAGGTPRATGPDLAAWRAAGCPPLTPRPGHTWDDAQGDEQRRRSPAAGLRRIVRGVRSRVARGHGTVQGVGAMGVPIPAEVAAAEVPAVRQHLDWQGAARYRDRWPVMDAFALPTYADGRVRCNLVGREQSGTVTMAAHARLLDALEEDLRACTDLRTGTPAVVAIERCSDPATVRPHEADLLVEFAPSVDGIAHPRLGTVGPFPLRRTAGHSPDGFVVVAAPGATTPATAFDGGDLGPRDVAAAILACVEQATGRQVASPVRTIR